MERLLEISLADKSYKRLNNKDMERGNYSFIRQIYITCSWFYTIYPKFIFILRVTIKHHIRVNQFSVHYIQNYNTSQIHRALSIVFSLSVFVLPSFSLSPMDIKTLNTLPFTKFLTSTG